MSDISPTPDTPYYAVVFTTISPGTDHAEHDAMFARMYELAGEYDGFIGAEHARNEEGAGIAVSYWRDLATIEQWASHPEHKAAKEQGRAVWYDKHMIRIAKVERQYGGSKS